MIGSDKRVGKSERHQSSMLRAMFQLAVGLQYGDASPFRAHQGAGHIEPVFRQQLIQVVPGNPPRNLGKPSPHQVAISIPDAHQAGVDLPPASPGADDGLQLIF